MEALHSFAAPPWFNQKTQYRATADGAFSNERLSSNLTQLCLAHLLRVDRCSATFNQ